MRGADGTGGVFGCGYVCWLRAIVWLHGYMDERVRSGGVCMDVRMRGCAGMQVCGHVPDWLPLWCCVCLEQIADLLNQRLAWSWFTRNVPVSVPEGSTLGTLQVPEGTNETGASPCFEFVVPRYPVPP